ncbi:MAG: aspartate 1-decarboxylase [Deltaproteobacteria bacterium]|nr:aspartate 1-decarboxylase [Deltaproteobacteria bacterium]
MFRRMLRSKIHRATVTRTELQYEGSITVDVALLEAAGMLSYEAVWVWNINNGERFETYVLAGKRGTGEICLNGAAARKVQPGDLVIIAAFGWMEEQRARQWSPQVVMVDARNRLIAEAA